ncbi:UTP--glucose-1-phosphate uridylyltransferase [Bradymonadaceae bacterium TMQ3]|uniref:UTP--glucose-1-phosphate uridylyltransferase n=1 Tax=Lujinxingia sediminis TaxID=2480984 RepID=A0ABY0CQK9_9DELT|nr:UTP--glucose-1-phosphate uridylyltransferase GalU [Lujinxingia sediminis]RDV38961.1 UTP--glucose-1-phosphate uridylyltransferase [Bradymonadaceae bacterium TMQ3]RVU42645.1 UTP--glucose-1-phosphate uridylyltransferase GalU [Lujinxingia sediminis]TXC76746.1 UTP--glucose-1-phosphate uridylyltransferase GalU [Bradymonadales bacterium TMQ1]
MVPNPEKKTVRKAVIPVAGFGTRLLPVTKSVPKELLPVVDVPAIQVVVEECVQAGIEEVILITGRGKGGVEDHFDYNFELENILEVRGKVEELERVRSISQMIRTVAIRQKKPLGLGHAILCAREVVGDEPFVVVLPDDLIGSSPSVTRQLIEVYERYGQAVVSVMPVGREEVSRYGIITGENWAPGLHRVRGIVEKPEMDVAPSNLAVIGRYLLPPVIFDMLAEVEPDSSGEIQLTDALSRLSRERALVGYEFKGRRHDIGDKLGFLTANISYGLRHPELGPKLLEYLRRKVREADEADGK